MASLTPKQEKYVQGLIAGMSQREAYRASYNAEKMSDKTVDTKASALFHKGEVRARYDKLVELGVDEALWSRNHARKAYLKLIDWATSQLEGDNLKDPERVYFTAVHKLNELDNLYPTDQSGDGEVMIIDDII